MPTSRNVRVAQEIAATFGETWTTAKINQLATQLDRGQITPAEITNNVRNRGGRVVNAPNVPATGQGPTSAEGTAPIIMVSPDGTSTIVGPSEVNALLASGWRWPSQNEQQTTSTALATANPAFYPSATQTAEEEEPETPRDFRTEARLLFPWIPEELLGVFAEAWERYGDASLALGALRQDPRYEQYFPGNRRPDGSLYGTEADYLSTMEGYRRNLTQFGVNPTDFTQQMIGAWQNGVSPQENARKMGAVYTRIATNAPELRAYYARTIGASNLSLSAMFSNALDPSTPVEVFEQNLREAEIGGTASQFGFDIEVTEAERLERFGLDLAGARNLYTQAATQLPTLNALMDRFGDPDDDATPEDFADALVFRDPEQLRLFTRLVRQGTVEFGGGRLVRTDQAGAQRGLLVR